MKEILQKVIYDLPSPAFVCEEELLLNNLKLLQKVKDQSGVKILLALKGFSLYDTFDMCKKYLDGCCASGLHEAKLSYQEFGKLTHTFSPAFTDDEIDEILDISDTIVFNSFNQSQKYHQKAVQKDVKIGLRINPEVSTVDVELYNPCGIYSRLGITKKEFDKELKSNLKILEDVSGLHFHALCEQNVDALEMVLEKFEANFSQYFGQLKWLNFGGGHHITREDYDVDRLIVVLKEFKSRYPHLQIFLEPSEAIGWQTGYLKSTIIDIVHNDIDIAILDVSAETNMPDTLAMPYKADVRNSKNIKDDTHRYLYRLAGNSCLAGDVMGDYYFDKKLNIGDEIIFEDMIHYTMVKTTTFNGIRLPSIVIKRLDGEFELVKEFGYSDYKSRLGR